MIGYIDTASPGLEGMLGTTFEIRMDYYLYSWDRSSLLDVRVPLGVNSPYFFDWHGVLSGDNLISCGPILPGQNCIRHAISYPVSNNIEGFKLQDGNLVDVYAANGSQGIDWNPLQSPTRWSGFWSLPFVNGRSAGEGLIFGGD